MGNESKSRDEVSAELHEAIRKRAEEIYECSGRAPGHDVENWVRAEREIRAETERAPERRRAIVVKVNGEEIVGEYDPTSAEGYSPGEFARGEAVAVRFAGEKMYVMRPGRAELETTIVRKEAAVAAHSAT